MTLFRAPLLALGLAAAGSGCLTPQPPTGMPGGAARAEPAPFPGGPPGPTTKHTTAYADGYRAGVVHHLDGGTAPAAPAQYRLANYWDAASPAAEEWAAGFRSGAASARTSGLRGPNDAAPAPTAVARTLTPLPQPAPPASMPAFAAAGFRPVGQMTPPPATTLPPAPPETKVAAHAVAPPKVVPASAEVPAPVAKPAPERRPPMVSVERPKEAVPGDFAPWKPAQLAPPTVVREQ